MSWPRDLSHDLVNYYIQQHSIKSTNRTCLSPCSWWLTFLIHQISSIYCWKAHKPLSHLLRNTLSVIILVGIHFSSFSSSTSALRLLSSWLYKPSSDQTPSRNQKGLVTKRTACWTQQIRVLWEVDISIHSASIYGSCRMIDLVTMREVWSLGVNNKALRDNSRIVGTWSALGPEGLGLGALNRMVCWKTD